MTSQVADPPVRRAALDLLPIDDTSRLGSRLVTRGLITPAQLDEALAVQARSGVRLGDALVHLRLLSSEQVAEALAEQAGVPYVPLDRWDPSLDVARLLPARDARALGALPLYDDESGLVVAFTDAPTFETVQRVDDRLGRPVEPVLVSASAYDATMD
ncbi:MAG TPA: hypothetical protein VFX49_22790, partial [Chloroflexota bacterium]|nr:hypothetical protein [Chloroflexota bacterium]